MNARVQIGVHHSLPYCLRKGLSRSPEITDVVRLASQRAPGILLSVIPVLPALCVSAGVCTQVLMPALQALR